MKSIGFPEMFNGAVSKIVTDHGATAQNLKLVLQSYRGEFFGDPDYGSNLINIIYSQNSNVLLEDIVRDDIYTCIQDYIPQLKLERSDIKLSTEGDTLTCTVSATNILSNSDDMYGIALLSVEEY